MKVITLMNFKGGSAKTTSALNIGLGLEKQGYKVLFIDLDMQGNLSTNFKNDLNISISDCLKGNANINDTIKDRITRYDPNLIGASDKISPTSLKDSLKELNDKYDFVIIDTSPNRDMFSINSLVASDYIIVPTELEYYSIMGLNRIHNYVEKAQEKLNPKLKIMGILITRYNANLKLTKTLMPLLDKLAKDFYTKIFETKIRRDSLISQIQCRSDTSIFDKPNSKSCQDYTNLVNEILKEVKKNK